MTRLLRTAKNTAVEALQKSRPLRLFRLLLELHRLRHAPRQRLVLRLLVTLLLRVAERRLGKRRAEGNSGDHAFIVTAKPDYLKYESTMEEIGYFRLVSALCS